MRYIIMFFLFLIWHSDCALAKIYTTEILNELSKKLDDVNKDDIVLFDVDYVLTIYEDKILCPCGEKLRKELRKKLNKLGKTKKDFLDSKTVLQAKVKLVDAGMPILIKTLQKKSLNIIALTSSGVGPLGIISKQEKLKSNELQRLGIDFSGAFSKYKNLFNLKSGSLLPVFYQGILFSIPDKKGESLVIFLDKIKIKPNRIIFIDDRLENLKSVEAECIKRNVEFIGLHYIAAQKSPGQIDEKVAYYQYGYLIKNKQWLSDEKAKIHLTNNPEIK